MAEEERNPRAELERLEVYRLMAAGVAIGLGVIEIWLDTDVLDIPRALAWAAGAVICWLQSRVLRRMGESPYRAYALGIVMVLFAIWALL